MRQELYKELNEIRIKPLCSSFEKSIKITPDTIDGNRFIVATDQMEKGLQILEKYGYSIKKPPKNFDILCVGFEQNSHKIKVYYQNRHLQNKSGQLNIVCHTFIQNCMSESPKLYYTVLTDNPTSYITHFIQSKKLLNIIQSLITTYNGQRDYCLLTIENNKQYAFHIKLFDQLQMKHITKSVLKLVKYTYKNYNKSTQLIMTDFLKTIQDYHITWISVGLNNNINIYFKKLCNDCK